MINNLRSHQQPQGNNNDLAELGEKLKQLLANNCVPNDLSSSSLQPLMNTNLMNVQSEYNSLEPMSSMEYSANTTNNINRMIQSEHAQLNLNGQHTFSIFHNNFNQSHEQQIQFQQPGVHLIDNLNPSLYSLNRSSPIDNLRPVGLLQSTLIDSNQISNLVPDFQATNAILIENANAHCLMSKMSDEQVHEGQDALVSFHNPNEFNLPAITSAHQNSSEFLNNNSSEKSINSIDNQVMEEKICDTSSFSRMSKSTQLDNIFSR